MHTEVDQNSLEYRELAEKYNGYIIERAASRSRAEPGRWVGHFRARKEGAQTLSASIADLQNTKEDAEAKAVEIAKARVDDVLASKS